MTTLRRAGLWIGGLVILIGLIGLGALAVRLLARPTQTVPLTAFTLTTSPAQSEPMTSTFSVAPPLVGVDSDTPALTASHTPTLVSPSATVSLTAPTGTPGAGIPVTVIAETQTGPGISKSFDLPPGYYRVSFRTESGFEAVSPVVEQGDCGSEPLLYGGSGPFEGSATYESSGCRVHFEVSGAAAGWSLNVDTISTQGSPSLTLPLTMQGDKPMASGVVDLPQGDYVVAVDSQSAVLAVTPFVVDGLCLERPILVLAAPGSFKTTYRSAGCQVIFQISAATGPWTLSVTAKP